MIVQRNNYIQRNKQYSIKQKTQLSLAGMKYLKSELPWRALRLLQKTVRNELGISLISEPKLRQELINNDFDYNKGVVDLVNDIDDTHTELPYVAINQLELLVKKTISAHYENNIHRGEKMTFIHRDGLPFNTIWFLLSGKLIYITT